MWWLLAANLVALLTLAVVYPQPMVSPGALTPAHATLADRCSSCHTPFRGVAAEACISCHRVADIGIRTTKGIAIDGPKQRPAFHQVLSAQSCLSCHSEHPGARSSARKPTFSHALLSTAIQGQCSSCHVPPADALHPDRTANCATCHSQRSWKPATFDHDRFFPLSGPHKAECATCHTTGDFRTHTCFSCHEHEPNQLRAKHLSEGIRNIDNCVACHRSGRAEEENERGERD
jgi:hypothetical protein